ncbi:MFS transporter [Fodinicurvata sp. EGI_FJ10296]|uniref:MFS transporter n=1 Tax=Fodinicurvata sp. EGI_FJ10296 TaxID=3231908 RepID=UPI003454DFF8
MVNEFRTLLTAVAPLIISAGVMIVGNSLLGTMLTVRMDMADVPIDRIGLVMALFSVGFVAGTLVCERLVSAVGHIRSFAAFAAIASASVLMHALYSNDFLWMGLRMVTGFSIACLLTIIESWLNAKSPNALRGRVMGIYMTVFYLAAGGSQLILLGFDPAGFELFAVVAMIISLSLVPLALTRSQNPPEIVSDRLSLRALVAISPLGVMGCFVAGIVISAFNALAPVYARSITDTTDFVAVMMTAAIIGGFLFQLPIGRLSDHFDRRTVILWLSIAVTLIAFAIGLGREFPTWLILTLVFAFGGIAYTLYPISLTYANDYLQPSQLVPAAAGLLLCYGIGAILGPIAGAAAVRPFGISGLFFAIALAGAIMVVFTLWRMRRRVAPALEDQSHYVAIAPTSVASELDPRYEPEEGIQLEFDFDSVAGVDALDAPPSGDADPKGDTGPDRPAALAVARGNPAPGATKEAA